MNGYDESVVKTSSAAGGKSKIKVRKTPQYRQKSPTMNPYANALDPFANANNHYMNYLDCTLIPTTTTQNLTNPSLSIHPADKENKGIKSAFNSFVSSFSGKKSKYNIIKKENRKIYVIFFIYYIFLYLYCRYFILFLFCLILFLYQIFLFYFILFIFIFFLLYFIIIIFFCI